MKQTKEKYIVEPLKIGGGKKEDLESFISNKLNSDTYKALIAHIGDENILSINQAKGDTLKDKVWNYIDIMKNTEKKLKKMTTKKNC